MGGRERLPGRFSRYIVDMSRVCKSNVIELLMRIEVEEEEGFVEGIISIITTVSAQLPRLLFLSFFFLFFSYFVALIASLLFSPSGS